MSVRLWCNKGLVILCFCQWIISFTIRLGFTWDQNVAATPELCTPLCIPSESISCMCSVQASLQDGKMNSGQAYPALSLEHLQRSTSALSACLARVCSWYCVMPLLEEDYCRELSEHIKCRVLFCFKQEEAVGGGVGNGYQ